MSIIFTSYYYWQDQHGEF